MHPPSCRRPPWRTCCAHTPPSPARTMPPQAVRPPPRRPSRLSSAPRSCLHPTALTGSCPRRWAGPRRCASWRAACPPGTGPGGATTLTVQRARGGRTGASLGRSPSSWTGASWPMSSQG
ncbi:hypothetical protein E2I00_013224 [Balaenoptera physalus]|uniref:Uncharacterized protein n=1 Tax=Balaenoptera physalus TaxID=9770 RepID=A0A643CFI4_BALPH|nr:hypothetical protein E2I00_013224 [Balaenoptera physalus]